MIGDLPLQTWKWCDWLRKYFSISVLCPGLSLCLGSSLNIVLGVCMLQKPLQCWTCPFTFYVGQQKQMLVSSAAMFRCVCPFAVIIHRDSSTYLGLLIALIENLSPGLDKRGGCCLCLGPLWEGSDPQEQGSVVLEPGWRTAASCLSLPDPLHLELVSAHLCVPRIQSFITVLFDRCYIGQR